MQFSYTAKTGTGEIVESIVSAENRFAAARELRSRGYAPLSIEEQKKAVLDQLGSLSNLFSKIKTNDKILFARNLSGMIKAGLPLSRAISVLQKQSKNQKMNKILDSISKDVNAGDTFSVALGKYEDVFSKLFISMVRAGEESGNLAGALSDVATNLEKSNSLTKKVKGALIYPGVIMSAMVVIGVLMFAFVVPTLANTFKELGVTLPASTRALIFMGNFFSAHLILSFALIFAAAFAIYSLLRAKFMARIIDWTVIRIPLIGKLAREVNTARTARTISSLLSSGVSITRAVEITEDVVQNVYYKKVLIEARELIEKGAPFSKAFEEHVNLYPIMMSEMTEVGEETGKLSEMLGQIASFYEEEVEEKTKNLSTIIEPFLMILIGAGVGFFAISMISPLYTILGSIG